jgi:hypothetical protein
MIETLKEMLDKEPFAPFRIVLTSGDGFEIRNPWLVAMGDSAVHVLYPKSDRFAILRVNQIAWLEALEPAA